MDSAEGSPSTRSESPEIRPGQKGAKARAEVIDAGNDKYAIYNPVTKLWRVSMNIRTAEITDSRPSNNRIYEDLDFAPLDSANTSTAQGADKGKKPKPCPTELDLLRSACIPDDSEDLANNPIVQALQRDPTPDDSEDLANNPIVQTLQRDPTPEDSLPTGEQAVHSHGVKKDGIPDAAQQAKPKNKQTGLDPNSPPLSDIHRIFDLITEHAVSKGLLDACAPFGDGGIRVLTMCSGTESPFVAMDLVRKSLTSQGHGGRFKYEHLGSAEIEPFKQAFIERNFSPPVIFRDVTEFSSHSQNPDNEDYLPVTAYGARCRPPRDVHILIAGSSCVDYSNLNNAKGEWKGQRGEGESAMTLDGIGAYAQMHKPTIIIIENVEAAPWEEIKIFWRKKGYESVPLKLDTVDYYLPQTRNRGYLFGIHIERAKETGFDIEKGHKEWVTLMASFQRRASSPYCDFIFTDDDPRLQLSKHTGDDSRTKASVAWVNCRKRHVAVRVADGLGSGTPFTKRRGLTEPKLDDYADQSWAIRQSKRVLDVLDIRQLSYVVQRDFDMRYKHRNINVTQNVDRDEDRRRWGIVGCVTPKGCLFDTRRGAPLSGLEILSLQGFPITKLDLGKHTSSQLQDLAGNAMSTTVIGAAILSALIACHKTSGQNSSIFPAYINQEMGKDNTQRDSLSEVTTEKTLKAEIEKQNLEDIFQKWTSAPRAESLAEVVRLAVELQPLCNCEGLHRRSRHPLLFCPECYYTCCKGCNRDAHGQQKLSHLAIPRKDRPLANKFVKYLTELLPPVLQNRCPDDTTQLFNHGVFESARDLILQALGSQVQFQGIKFESSWKVVYESTSCRLELEFVQKRYLCDPCLDHEHSDQPQLHLEAIPKWLLFAKAPEEMPAKSSIRDLFRYPVARMQPHANLFEGVWEYWDGSSKGFKLHVTGKGAQVKSWEQSLGIEAKPFATLNAFSILEVSPPRGTQGDQPSAFDAVVGEYKLLQNCPAPSGTLHRRVVRPSYEAPTFLFLKSGPLNDACLDRVVFSTQPSRRDLNEDRAALVSLDASWRPVATAELAKGMDIDCEIMSQWSDCQGQSLEIPVDENTIHRWCQAPGISPMSSTGCAHSHSTILLLDLSFDMNAVQRLQCRRDLRIDLEREPEALSEFGWILSHAASIPQLSDGWRPIKDLEIAMCNECYPPAPSVRWILKKMGDKEKLVAMEIPLEAARYERLLKMRPKPAIALLQNLDGKVMLNIVVNVKTLAHRAVSQLLRPDQPIPALKSLEWRIDSYDRFAPPQEFAAPQLLSNEQDQVDPQIHADLRLKRQLWPTQSRALAWMYSQENSPPEWDEMSLVESCLPALGWRLETKALLPSTQVRGGIIADEVGAGKTTTSLALVELDYERSATAFKTDSQLTKFHSNATLILVPKNIVKQWESEIARTLSWEKLNSGRSSSITGPYYIVAETPKQLQGYSHEQIRSARLILAPWDIFQEEAYLKDLRNIACSPCVPDGRGFQEWLSIALSSLGSCVESLKQGETEFWAKWAEIRSKTAAESKYERFQGYVSRATHKAMNKAAKKKKGAAAIKDDDDDAAEEGPSKPHCNAPTSKDPDAQTEADGNNNDNKAKVSEDQGQEQKQVVPPKQRRKPVAKSSAEESVTTAEEGLRKELDAFEKKRKIPVLLHMFAFRRLIVDEFTYIQGETSMALLQLGASARWLLSGTPPIYDYDNLNTMAKLLGTRIATYDEKEGSLGFGKDGSRMTKGKTAAQEFHSYQDIASPAYKGQVYGLAREFSSKFIRKNETSKEGLVRKRTLYKFQLTPSELITYLDVNQLAMDPDRSFSQKEKPKIVQDPDQPKFVQMLTPLVDQSNGPTEAQLCSSLMLEKVLSVTAEANGQSDEEMLKTLINVEVQRLTSLVNEQREFVLHRTRQVLQLLRELSFLKDAVVETSAASFARFTQNAAKGNLADTAAVEIVKLLIDYSQENPSAPSRLLAGGGKTPFTPDGVKDATVGTKEVDVRVAMVESHLEVLLRGLRRLRFLGVVVGAFESTSPPGECSTCGEMPLHKAGLSVATQCGHLLCEQCLSKECCEFAGAGKVIPVSQFELRATSGAPASVAGARMRLAVALVKKATQEGDLVLVFAQFEGMKNAFVKACRAADIVCHDGYQGATAQAVETFRQSKEPGVLVLKVDSPDAAGWNLQVANHVIFLAPFVAGEEERKATIAQAIGRSWRFGQKKDVHVHHLAAMTTVEPGMVVWEDE
ncbi:uncharacterized protein Z520_04082 [Fonsecaea multimorphosa CBS 102226]|uniref:Helicase ATP-binding domain-containing protein n=1 Tax=Fonsecaea multimorphosa CBS 102226 TaxID=1442371 RepID=A0A0D2ITV7_9EURO|nr:uncharacterized protein Z520_04082 [Fonsecaea multimorphosa CBS 102226]KIY00397.1 hypothetical protein Z520_04082 [Fonsecaea multimorphosa CBS 102226]OAL26913.1 hypothetical protein AYO22_03857 [Fonsecaea multimorphosa]